jgi:hypothetical protein
MASRPFALGMVAAAAVGWTTHARAHELPQCNVMYHDYLFFEQTYLLYPTGEDDTENLRCVLHEAWHDGGGAKVRLVEGTYHLDAVAIAGFEGTLYGQGPGVTRIVPLSAVRCEEDVAPALLRFIGGDVAVEDLTIDLLAGGICDDGSGRRIEEALAFAGMGGTSACEGTGFVPTAAGVASGLELLGGGLSVRPGERWMPTGTDELAPVRTCEGWGGGDYRITGSRIAGASLVAENLHEGSLAVGSACGAGNVLEGGDLVLSGFADAVVDVRFNVVGGTVGIDHLAGTGGRYRVAYNTIRADPGAAAIDLDLFGTSRLDAVIGRNLVETDGGEAALVGEGAPGVTVAQNRFVGTAGVGIWLGAGSAEGWDVVDDDLGGLGVADAAVWLDAGTSAVFVRGAAMVRDEGDGNVLEAAFPVIPEAVGVACPADPDDFSWARVARPGGGDEENGGPDPNGGGDGAEPGGNGGGDPGGGGDEPGGNGHGGAGGGDDPGEPTGCVGAGAGGETGCGRSGAAVVLLLIGLAALMPGRRG